MTWQYATYDSQLLLILLFHWSIIIIIDKNYSLSILHIVVKPTILHQPKHTNVNDRLQL